MTDAKDKRVGNPRVFKGERARLLWAAIRRLRSAERERKPKTKPPKGG